MTKVLRDLDCHEVELSILFTDDSHIAELNRCYLSREGATNVLAFPMLYEASPNIPSLMLGDIVISVDTAMRESKRFGELFEETIFRLLIHGLLHLLGHDHEKSPKEAENMENEERRLLHLIGKG